MANWAADCADEFFRYSRKLILKTNSLAKPSKYAEHGSAQGFSGWPICAEASLAAHAAAREAKENEAACFATRAAGQAVATAHVPQHAYGGAYYALKAIAAIDPVNAEVKVAKERNWQSQHIPEHLRGEIMQRIIIQKNGNKVIIKIRKGEGY